MTTPFAEQLARLPFFEGMEPKHLRLLASHATVHQYEPRELIFREGDAAESFLIIRKGRVAIEVFTPERGPVSIQTVDADDVLGWSWLVEPFRWHFDAQVIEPTEAIAFNAKAIRESMTNDAELGYALLKRFMPVVGQRLQAAIMQLMDVYHVHV